MRLLRWLRRKTINPPADQRDEPDELRQTRKEFSTAHRENDKAIQELRRVEEAVRKR